MANLRSAINRHSTFGFRFHFQSKWDRWMPGEKTGFDRIAVLHPAGRLTSHTATVRQADWIATVGPSWNYDYFWHNFEENEQKRTLFWLTIHDSPSSNSFILLRAFLWPHAMNRGGFTYRVRLPISRKVLKMKLLKFPRLNGWCFSYLLPRQAFGTRIEKHNKILRPIGSPGPLCI